MNNKIVSALLCTSAIMLAASAANADVRTYVSQKKIFSTDNVQCDVNLYGDACLDNANPIIDVDLFKDSLTYYGIDSAYGFDVMDFDPSVAEFNRPMDGNYTEGYAANIYDGLGNVIGLKAKNDATPGYLTGMLKGEIMAGLGGLSVKAGTEKYTVMDHICNAPWMPPLIEIMRDPVTDELTNLGDYTTRMKDDGKILYQWGNYKKRPTQLRVFTSIPVPDEWKVAGADYQVKSAKLIVTHLVTTSPNDQIRPEDYENEWATGIKPKYTVDAGGRWLSAVDAFEGDGDFIPAGTVFKDPALIDLVNGRDIGQWLGFTNAWFTSLDRDPFGGDNPRFRLKSSKFGQDIPGVEIPWYTAGSITTSTIDVLAWNERDPVTHVALNPPVQSPLAMSSGWDDTLDLDPFNPEDTVKDGISYEGATLTPDLDLMLYIKGEYSGTAVYDAQLVIEWEDPNYTAVPVPEVCNDLIDNDLDGTYDCADTDCADSVLCQAPGAEFCDDGIDNDADGFVDCSDQDCSGNEACIGNAERCTDLIDNDTDGLTDCEDPDCVDAPICFAEICNDGIDNNDDGLVDCGDPDCADVQACIPEICDDGVDNDGDAATDCADAECFNSPECMTSPEICSDGFDNDSDGLVDCADPDCADTALCGDEGRDVTCSDGVDNDVDGLVDCDDDDCSKNKSCR